MENGYSLSDIAAASGAEGFGGSAWWIIILFLFAFMNGGFGGNNSLNQYATAASQQEILFGQQFQNLNSAINKVGDGLSSLGYSQLQQMDANTSSINGNITAEGRAIQSQLCAINSNIDNKFAALEKSSLEQRIAEQAQQINQLQLAQAMCGVPKVTTTIPCGGCGCGYSYN